MTKAATKTKTKTKNLHQYSLLLQSSSFSSSTKTQGWVRNQALIQNLIRLNKTKQIMIIHNGPVKTTKEYNLRTQTGSSDDEGIDEERGRIAQNNNI